MAEAPGALPPPLIAAAHALDSGDAAAVGAAAVVLAPSLATPESDTLLRVEKSSSSVTAQEVQLEAVEEEPPSAYHPEL